MRGCTWHMQGEHARACTCTYLQHRDQPAAAQLEPQLLALGGALAERLGHLGQLGLQRLQRLRRRVRAAAAAARRRVAAAAAAHGLARERGGVLGRGEARGRQLGAQLAHGGLGALLGADRLAQLRAHRRRAAVECLDARTQHAQLGGGRRLHRRLRRRPATACRAQLLAARLQQLRVREQVRALALERRHLLAHRLRVAAPLAALAVEAAAAAAAAAASRAAEPLDLATHLADHHAGLGALLLEVAHLPRYNRDAGEMQPR